jgi:hypothetical protein
MRAAMRTAGDGWSQGFAGLMSDDDDTATTCIC